MIEATGKLDIDLVTHGCNTSPLTLQRLASPVASVLLNPGSASTRCIQRASAG